MHHRAQQTASTATAQQGALVIEFEGRGTKLRNTKCSTLKTLNQGSGTSLGRVGYRDGDPSHSHSCHSLKHLLHKRHTGSPGRGWESAVSPNAWSHIRLSLVFLFRVIAKVFHLENPSTVDGFFCKKTACRYDSHEHHTPPWVAG